MAFYNSGIRRMLDRTTRVGVRQNLQEITKLKENEASDDTSRTNIDSQLSTTRTALTALTSTVNTYVEADKIYTQEFTDLYNRFVFGATINSAELATAIDKTKMVHIVSLQVFIYNPDLINATPSYNAASLGHFITVTRNKNILTASSANFTNASGSGNIMSFGHTGGATWLVGQSGTSYTGPHCFTANMDSGSHRRSTDHLNQAPGILNNLDEQLYLVVVPQSGIAQDTSRAGNGTKIKVVVKYRLSDFPTLT